MSVRKPPVKVESLIADSEFDQGILEIHTSDEGSPAESGEMMN